jgi:hypothetical protein
MAYIEKIMYSMTCDNCSKDICDDETEFTAITPKERVTEIANHAEWAIVDTDKGERHYCTDCHTVAWDEEEDVKLIFVGGQQVGIAY